MPQPDTLGYPEVTKFDPIGGATITRSGVRLLSYS
jgi:hypothetical protein